MDEHEKEMLDKWAEELRNNMIEIEEEPNDADLEQKVLNVLSNVGTANHADLTSIDAVREASPEYKIEKLEEQVAKQQEEIDTLKKAVIVLMGAKKKLPVKGF